MRFYCISRHQKEGDDLKKSLVIAFHQIMAWRRDYKAWAAFMLCLAFCIMNASRYVSFSAALGYRIQAAEAYVIIGSSIHYYTGILLGALLLLSDAPFINVRSPYEILRAGKRIWTRGQISYIVMSVILYSLFTILFCAALSALSGNIYFENSWSEAMSLLAKRQPSFAILDFKLAFPYGEFIDAVCPYGAMFMTLFFNSCYICLLCLCMFAVNVRSGRCSGWIAAIVVHIAGYVIVANGPIVFPQRYSLLACSFPANQYVEALGITPLYAATIFAVLIGMLIFISDRRARMAEI